MIRWNSLRNKIVAWSFIPTAIILLAVALVAYYAYQRSTVELLIEQNRELARLSAGQVSSEMSQYTGNLAVLARTLSDFRGSSQAQRAALDRAANRMVVFDGGVVLLDEHGEVLAAQPARPEIVGNNWSDRAYFRLMAQSPGPLLSDVVNDGPGGEPVIAVAVPVSGAQGEFLGMLAGMFRLGAPTVSPFYGSLVKLRLAPNATAFLVDRNGEVIFHSDSGRVGENFAAQRAVLDVLRGRVGAVRTRDDGGNQVVVSYAPVPGSLWGLVIEADWQALLRANRTYGEFLLVLLALGVVIPAIVVAFGVRRITQPINDLIGAAQEVASGNFGHTVAATTGDEVEDLVKQFNRMSLELKSSYSALRDRNEQLELIMRSSNDGIWDWDLRTNQTYFSPRWKSILGYADDEITNEFASWRGLLHPEDIEPTTAALQAYLDSLSPAYSPEFRLRHKDGSYRWILARGVSLRDAQDKPYRMVGSHTDITEQKRAQAVLAGQRHFLELLARGENFPETLNALVRAMEEQSPGVLGMVRLLDQDAATICCGVAPSLPDELVRFIEASEAGFPPGSCDAAASEGKRVVIENIAADPRAIGVRDIALAHGLWSCWSEPIFSQGSRLEGAFTMFSRAPRGPTTAELRSIETAARLVGIALEHKQAQAAVHAAYQTLERRVAERTQELATLNAIAAVVSRSLDLQEIMADALEQTMPVVGADAGGAYRMRSPTPFTGQSPAPSAGQSPAPFAEEHDGDTLELVAHRGLSEEFARYAARMLLTTALAGRPISKDHPIIWSMPEYPDNEIKDHLAQEGLQSLVGVPLVSSDRLVGGLILSYRTPRTLAPDEESLLMAVGRQIGVAVENADLYMSEQDRREEAERRRQVAEGLRETLDVLNSRQSLAETLDHIVAQACRLLGSDAAALMRLQEAKGPLVMQAAYGLAPEYVSGIRPPLGQGSAGIALVERRAVSLPDLQPIEETIWREPDRYLPAEPDRSLWRRFLRDYRAYLSVPLIIRDEAYGTITLYYREPHDFSDEEIRLATAVANQAALAIESARLREKAQHAAATAERTRLARELHDSVTQSLYSVTLYSEAAARLLESGKQDPAVGYLREVRDTAQEALREMRLLIFELRPPALEEVGLAGALQARLQAVEARGGMSADLQVDGVVDEERIPLHVQSEIYHIVQEALNNVIKHAHAEHVWVHLGFFGPRVCAEVRDDGKAFALADAEESGGVGIQSMRERAERIGASLSIQSQPGKGTTVKVELGSLPPGGTPVA
jgi:PAS domain S-box-containing protein